MKKLFAMILFLVGIVLQPGLAQAFVVDGNLSDWGITPGVWGASQWTPNAGIQYTQEDQSPSVPGGYLNPGYGGQTFDAEGLYATHDDTNLYFAIITGKAPGVESGYRPGDIAFDFGNNGSFEYGIETTTGGLLSQGGLYSVNSWNHGLWNLTDPTEMNSVNGLIGVGGLAYNNTYYGATGHYVIEGYIPLSFFGSDWGQNFRMQWTQTCGNDVIGLNVVPNPEPATVALFSMGLAGLGLLRRRKENV